MILVIWKDPIFGPFLFSTTSHGIRWFFYVSRCSMFFSMFLYLSCLIFQSQVRYIDRDTVPILSYTHTRNREVISSMLSWFLDPSFDQKAFKLIFPGAMDFRWFQRISIRTWDISGKAQPCQTQPNLGFSLQVAPRRLWEKRTRGAAEWVRFESGHFTIRIHHFLQQKLSKNRRIGYGWVMISPKQTEDHLTWKHLCNIIKADIFHNGNPVKTMQLLLLVSWRCPPLRSLQFSTAPPCW